jgi:hypothetical protein
VSLCGIIRFYNREIAQKVAGTLLFFREVMDHDENALPTRLAANLDNTFEELMLTYWSPLYAFEALLAPHGVAVYLEAHHLCVAMRGVRETSPFTHTTFWRGEYANNAALRAEFLLLCGS